MARLALLRHLRPARQELPTTPTSQPVQLIWSRSVAAHLRPELLFPIWSGVVFATIPLLCRVRVSLVEHRLSIPLPIPPRTAGRSRSRVGTSITSFPNLLQPGATPQRTLSHPSCRRIGWW